MAKDSVFYFYSFTYTILWILGIVCIRRKLSKVRLELFFQHCFINKSLIKYISITNIKHNQKANIKSDFEKLNEDLTQKFQTLTDL